MRERERERTKRYNRSKKVKQTARVVHTRVHVIIDLMRSAGLPVAGLCWLLSLARCVFIGRSRHRATGCVLQRKQQNQRRNPPHY